MFSFYNALCQAAVCADGQLDIPEHDPITRRKQFRLKRTRAEARKQKRQQSKSEKEAKKAERKEKKAVREAKKAEKAEGGQAGKKMEKPWL